MLLPCKYITVLAQTAIQVALQELHFNYNNKNNSNLSSKRVLDCLRSPLEVPDMNNNNNNNSNNDNKSCVRKELQHILRHCHNSKIDLLAILGAASQGKLYKEQAILYKR